MSMRTMNRPDKTESACCENDANLDNLGTFPPIPPRPCPQLPGTILRIFIPAGATINLLNLIEVTSPSGICLIIRTPILGGSGCLAGIVDSIKAAGGTVEFI